MAKKEAKKFEFSKVGSILDNIAKSVPIKIEKEPDSREVLALGELGFWPVIPFFCVLFGPTPMSQINEPRAASPVNVFGKITGSLTNLEMVNENDLITVIRINQ